MPFRATVMTCIRLRFTNQPRGFDLRFRLHQEKGNLNKKEESFRTGNWDETETSLHCSSRYSYQNIPLWGMLSSMCRSLAILINRNNVQGLTVISHLIISLSSLALSLMIDVCSFPMRTALTVSALLKDCLEDISHLSYYSPTLLLSCYGVKSTIMSSDAIRLDN